MRLKARERPAISSAVCASGTRTARSPPRTRSAAWISRPIGRAIWLAIMRPISTAANSTSSATSAKIQAKAICSQDRFWSSRSYSATAFSVRTMWSRICGSIGRPIISISGGVESSCTTARTLVWSAPGTTATSPGAGALGCPLRRRLDAEPGEQAGGSHHLASHRLVDDRLGQSAQRGLGRQDLGEGVRIDREHAAGARQIVGHLERHRPDVVLVFLEIAARGLQQLVERGAHGIVEPGLDAVMEEGGREHRDHDRGRDRDDAEQQDEPDMQSRTGRAAPPLDPDLRDPSGEHRPERQQHGKVGQHECRRRPPVPRRTGSRGRAA